MAIYCHGRARIKHEQSGVTYEIKNDELDWAHVDSCERQMGLEIQYEAVLDHPALGELTWSVWEYPVGIENYTETNVAPHEMLKNFDYGLKIEEPRQEWIDYTVPEEPFDIFMDSYHETGDMLADYGSEHGDSLINRLVFSHQVTALEAYLGDTLMNVTEANADAVRRLIEKDNELAKRKFSLAEISEKPNLVQNEVRKYLKSILYHNIWKVDALYNVAMGVRILPLASDKDSLFRAIMLRHDCVHRNGFDKSGYKHRIFY